MQSYFPFYPFLTTLEKECFQCNIQYNYGAYVSKYPYAKGYTIYSFHYNYYWSTNQILNRYSNTFIIVMIIVVNFPIRNFYTYIFT